MRNQSHLNGLSMFSKRQQTTPLAWSRSPRIPHNHATKPVTIEIMASHAAAHRRVSRLGIAAGAYKAVSDQSISLTATGFGNAGLPQSFIVAICTHIAAEGMHVPHEGNGELGPYADYF